MVERLHGSPEHRPIQGAPATQRKMSPEGEKTTDRIKEMQQQNRLPLGAGRHTFEQGATGRSISVKDAAKRALGG